MNAKKRSTILLGTLAALAVALLLAVPTLAQKVDNPGAIAVTSDHGTLRVKDQTFDFDASKAITFNGTLTKAGVLTIPKANVVFPDQFVSASGYNFRIRITATQDATGTLDPLTGKTTLNASLRVDADPDGSAPPSFGSDCHIGPIAVALSSTKSGGVGYDTSTGKVTVADSGFAVPGATGCGSILFVNYNSEINDALGLPTSDTSAVITAGTNPVVHKGVAASFTATPASGFAPLNVSFDASGSHVAAGPASYRWDFDGNGSVDQTSATPTATHTYSSGGYVAKLTVVDKDGDADTATKSITVGNRTPDVRIDKSHAGDFLASSAGTYSLAVRNVGSGPTTGTTTVTDVLPNSLGYVSASGDGWSCSATGQTVTCEHPDPIADGDSAAPITLTVDVSGDAIPTVTNTASVSTPGDTSHGNDADADTANVLSPESDLTLRKSHEGDYFLRTGPADPRGTWDLQVKNVGTQPTAGTITVTDPLPVGATFHAAFGDGWDCGAADGTVTCTTDQVVDGGASAPVIRVVADIAQDAPDSLENVATVKTDSDHNAANDSGTDTVATRPFGVDLSIHKSHDGTFVRGETDRYRIEVANHGTEGSTGPITVTDELPDGLSYVSAAGVGWSCSADHQTVTCTRAESLDAGRSAQAITLRVKVGAEAADGVTNVASVSAPEPDLDPSDNQDADPTNLRGLRPDLSIDKSHSGSFTAGRFGTYTLAVKNEGADPTFDVITVTDTLPDGLAYDSAAGTGWACGADGQEVTCTRTDALAPGASAPPITLRVVPGVGAVPSITNTAGVQTRGDASSANDSDSDATLVDNPPANTGLITNVTGYALYPGSNGGRAEFWLNITRRNLGFYYGTVAFKDSGAGVDQIANVNLLTGVSRYGLNGAQGDALLKNGQRVHWTVDDLSAINLGPDRITISDPDDGYTGGGTVLAGDFTVK